MSLFQNEHIVEPFKEMIAYETLWSIIKKPTFKKVSEKLQNNMPTTLSLLYSQSNLDEVSDSLKSHDLSQINALIAGTESYPSELKKLEYFLPLLYFRGDIDLLNMPAISIVGSRKASDYGKKQAALFSKMFVASSYAVISGLAKGIDTAAHTSAIKNKGKTIAVLGTPLNESYPKENSELQKYIEKHHLLISQVPFVRYNTNKRINWSVNRFFFPERNKTMAALSEATIIIEASNTSGTLIQARECLRMGKKLIIHSNILKNKSLTWPQNYLNRPNTYVANDPEEALDIIK